MDIFYLGHSCFKLRGKRATVVMDPYASSVGLELKKQSADIVTISHDHDDHNHVASVGGTVRREKPYVISAPGEYEVEGVGVFGWGSFHDANQGVDRGKNTIYVVHMDGIRVAHLGDLGHVLSEGLIKDLGELDVLLVPVGGHYTINAKQAAEVIKQLSPSIVVPMHYRTEGHNEDVFADVKPLRDCLDDLGVDDAIQPEEKLTLLDGQLPEETEVHVLQF